MGMDAPPKVPLKQLIIGSRSPEPPPVIPQPLTGLGRLRKIALIGAAGTVDFAPWYDPTWEIWAHSTCYPYCKRVDRYFDLHPWKWISEKPVPGYLNWLKSIRTPVYMQRKFREIPASVRYPRERILAEWPRYFTSQAAWMIALALSEGVTHLGFFGIHYSLDEEHRKQRAGCEFWMGVAIGRGVQIVNPPGSPLIRQPAWLYGYESHDGKKHIREQTGGKKPTKKLDMDLPPQDLKVEELGYADAQTILGHARVDCMPMDVARAEAMFSGKPPLLPNGQPAW